MTRGVLLRAAAVVVFLAAIVWQVLGAVSDLLLWLNIAALTHGQLSATAWFLLGLGLAVPALVAVGALVAARGRGTGGVVLILVAALGVSRALGVTQLAFFLQVVGSL